MRLTIIRILILFIEIMTKVWGIEFETRFDSHRINKREQPDPEGPGFLLCFKFHRYNWY